MRRMDRPDITPDTDEGRWLTYRQIGEFRHISKASAERLVRRHRWRRQVDNQGVTRVLVPPDWLTAVPADTPAGLPDITLPRSPDVTPDSGLLADAVAALEDAVAGLRSQLAEAANRAETAEHRAAAADADRREAVTLAQKSVAMLTEERSRADRAEAATAGERQRADALRDRLIGAQAEVSLAQAAADHARAEAREAQDAAEELREAVQARKAKGRLRRILAAWRGE
jgi:hypothetical protein